MSNKSSILRTRSSKFKTLVPERDGLPWRDDANLRRRDLAGLVPFRRVGLATAEAKQVGMSVCQACSRHPCSAHAIELLQRSYKHAVDVGTQHGSSSVATRKGRVQSSTCFKSQRQSSFKVPGVFHQTTPTHVTGKASKLSFRPESVVRMRMSTWFLREL